ncbi:protein vav-1-like [Penaeus monodon]|uniref:protein vav-1-like n=1 Tax=Penaeus monodon TaxID=6687 RepID=UPI0018A70EED|nr:protein vav-1-like [Penaeus monodon]
MMCKSAKWQEEKYVFKDCVKLENCKVEDTVLATSGGTIRNKQNSFFLVVSGNKKAYTIITKDLDSKEKWMKSITDAIESLSPPENQTQNHSFSITTFKMPNTRCSICKKLMKGSIFQGYQCPTCKMIVHKSCLNKLTQNHTCTIEYPGNQFSVSLAVPHNAPQPPIPDNLQVQEYPWWAERMSRNEATIHLGLAAEGTFLLRWSDHNEQPVLSLKAMGEVKHMRVYRQEETGYFYLSEARYFTSVVDLVHHYRSSPLSESFTGLDCCLRRPIYDTAIVRYPYEGPGAGHLRLVQGQRVIIISREGEGRGWWKGRIVSRMGYFQENMSPWKLTPLLVGNAATNRFYSRSSSFKFLVEHCQDCLHSNFTHDSYTNRCSSSSTSGKSVMVFGKPLPVASDILSLNALQQGELPSIFPLNVEQVQKLTAPIGSCCMVDKEIDQVAK